MALHLNLYHEIEMLHAQRARDPLKISLMLLGFLAAGFACYYLWQLGKLASLDRELARVRADFAAIESLAKTAGEQEATLQATITTGESLARRIEGRFYWAPVLEQLIKVVPPEVQITKVLGESAGDAVKQCQITIEGISAGADPRRVAEDLRLALTDALGTKYKNVTSSFRQLEEGANHIQIDGKDWPTATFAITIQLQHGEKTQATPAPRTGRRRAGT